MLFDIDVIIRRTPVYGLLTTTLALVYFGGVVILQQIFSQVSGDAGKLRIEIVISTLMIAALFNPYGSDKALLRAHGRANVRAGRRVFLICPDCPGNHPTHHAVSFSRVVPVFAAGQPGYLARPRNAGSSGGPPAAANRSE